MAYQNKTVTTKTEVKSSSPSQIFDKSGKKATLLKDNSWIRKASTEEESTDGSTNFGRVVLGRFKSQENLDRPPETTKASPVSQGSYVQSLTKRFSTSQDELAKSGGGSPVTDKTTTSTRSTSSTFKPEIPKPPPLNLKTDGSKTTVSTKTIADGKTTETTVVTTRTSGFQSSVKSETVTDGASDATVAGKGSSTAISSKTTKTTVTPVTPTKDTADRTSVVTTTKTTKSEVTPVTPTKNTTDRTTIVSSTKTITTEVASVTPPKDTGDRTTVVTTTKTTKSEVVPVTPTKQSPDWTTVVNSRTSKTPVSPVTTSDRSTVLSSTKTTRTEVTPLSPSDKTFFESSIKPIKTEVTPVSTDREYSRTISTEYSPRSSVTTRTSYNTYTTSDYTPTTRVTSTTYSTISSDTSYDRSSTLSSPSLYSKTLYTSNRPDDYLSDNIISTSTKTLYSTLDRSVTEKDFCSYCRKPMSTEPKIILGDMQINCHATCFKCEVCNGSLGHLKAGDTMWVYRRTVHCERCFGIAREKWRL